MSLYLYKMMNGLDKPDKGTKILFIIIATLLLTQYIIKIILYLFPYVYLYGLK